MPRHMPRSDDGSGFELDLPTIASMPLVWGGYIMRPGDTKYTDTKDAPNEPGLYAWHSADGDLMYIGRSNTVRDRLRRHLAHSCFFSGEPRFFSFRRVPKAFLATMEVAHIQALEPLENIFEESAGVSVRGFIEPAIEAAWASVRAEQQERLYRRYSAHVEQIAARL